MDKSTSPIGLFDSGVGGISIWKEIHMFLPGENTIYLADSKNAPYGQKSKEEILDLSIKNTEFLLRQDCKMIVVACNTATTNAIKELRAMYHIPFIGIEPAIKPAAFQTSTRNIGILATKGTLNSELFHAAMKNYTDINIVEQVGYGLVKLIEEGQLNSDETKQLLTIYLQPMIEANIDCLVLGCSHYPFLVPQIKKILPDHVKIIDSGLAVARQTKKILEEENLLNNSGSASSQTFYTNANPKILQGLLDYQYPIIEKDF